MIDKIKLIKEIHDFAKFLAEEEDLSDAGTAVATALLIMEVKIEEGDYDIKPDKCKLEVYEPYPISFETPAESTEDYVAIAESIGGYLVICKTGCGHELCLFWDSSKNEEDFIFCPYCQKEFKNDD